MKVRKIEFPCDNLISRHLPADYADAYEGIFPVERKISTDEVMIGFWTFSPIWVKWLFKLRDWLVKPFGIQPGSNLIKERLVEAVRSGGSYGMLEVVSKSDSETVICLTDRHLKMHFSVQSRFAEGGGQKLIFSTIVHFSNFLGRAYFYSIYPAHCLIVPRMIKHSLQSASRLG